VQRNRLDQGETVDPKVDVRELKYELREIRQAVEAVTVSVRWWSRAIITTMLGLIVTLLVKL
jgi:hypothetical protein